MKKKFLSLVLACSLMVGSLPFAAYAEDTTAPTTDNTTSTSQTAGDQTAGEEDTTVTYPTPVAAILVDKADQPQTKLYDSYSLTANGNALAISATNLVKHTNDNKTEAYWVGAAFPAPTGALAYKMAASWSPVTADDVGAATQENNIANVTTDGQSGAAIYTDGRNHKNDTLYVGIMWYGREGVILGETQFYTITFADVQAFVPATGITLNQSAITLEETDTYQLTATVTPADCSQTVTWSSRDTDVAIVDQNGLVTARDHRDVNEGDNATVTITATVGDQTATCTVTVAPKPVSGVTLDKTSVNLYKGASATLKATVAPATATFKSVYWESDDKNVVTVDDDGVITAVGAGTTTITVTTAKGGKTATCAVTVTDAANVNSESALEDAIKNSVDGDAIVLSDDITLTGKLTINKAITIEGNGHKINGDNDNTGVYVEVTGGNVTIQNTTFDGFADTIATEVADVAVIKVPDDATAGKLTLKNVNVEGVNRAAVVVRKGTFLIDGCRFECTNTASGTTSTHLTKGVLVNGATGEITDTTILRAYSDYTAEGNAWSTAAVEVWGTSTVTIKNSTLGNEDSTVDNGVSVTPDGGTATVTITDTNIKADNRCVIMHPDEKGGKATATVTGGTMFSEFMNGSQPNPYAGAFKVNSGEGCTLNVNSVTLSSAFDILRAIECAAPSGVTITMTTNLDLDSFKAYMPDGLAVAGKTVTLQGAESGIDVSGSTITANEGATLTFGANVTVSSKLVADKGTIYLNGASYTGGKDNLVKGENGGNIYITAGTFSFDPTDFVPGGYNVTADDATNPTAWTVTKRTSSGGGGGGGSSSKKDNTTKTDETKQDEVKQEETTTPETIAPGEATSENISQVFGDAKSSDWYAEAAAYVYNNNLMKGDENGNFGANDSATRGQIVTILHRLANTPNAGSSTFKDINGNEYYADGVAWAAELGIVTGYEDGTFGANGSVTREELATILYRFAKIQNWLGDTTGDLSSFSDAAATSDWATEALAWAVGAGLLQGDENGALNPTGTATRAEIATILMRFCENIAK